MMAATYGWAVMLQGYVTSPIKWPERALFGAASLTIIFGKTGTLTWAAGCALLFAMVVWAILLRPRVLGSSLPAGAPLK
jgi:hypothetical protein